MAEIEQQLIQYADDHGKLTKTFQEILADKGLSMGDKFRIVLYNLTLRANKAKQVPIEAARRKGTLLESLVNDIAEVFDEQHQTSINGVARSREMQTRNIAHMKYLDDKLVKSLTDSYKGQPDYLAAEQEVGRLEKELFEIQTVMESVEAEVQAAKDVGDLARVSSLTQKLTDLLEVKRGVYDGRYGAEGAVLEIRRNMLDKAEGIQSAKGALAASRVNYEAITALIDAYTKLEIKYRHARSDMIPVFRIQAQIGAGAMQAAKLTDSLIRAAAISEQLMAFNESIVRQIGRSVQDLLQTQLYDEQRAAAIEDRLKEHMRQLAKNDIEWAQNLTTVRSTPGNVGGGYARPS